MFSVIVPAHNESAVIAAGLRAMIDGARPGELEIIVVANGCGDDTAAVARAFGDPVKVVETDVASKTHALNLGDGAATGFPRIYIDADVILPLDGLRRLAGALQSGGALAAAPAAEMVLLDGTRPSVRAYYELWMALPYVKQGMVAAGTYALSVEGRSRFERFPDIIADDGYVRLLFRHGERIEVPDAVCRVLAPLTIADLVKIKTRSRLGVLELAQKFPELFSADARRKRHARAFLGILAQPSLYPGLIPYAWVTVISWIRARSQARQLHLYVWERDNSSRIGATQAPDARIGS